MYVYVYIEGMTLLMVGDTVNILVYSGSFGWHSS